MEPRQHGSRVHTPDAHLALYASYSLRAPRGLAHSWRVWESSRSPQWPRVWANLCSIPTHSLLEQSCQAGIMTAPIIQMRKQRHTRTWFCQAVAITFTHSRDQRGQKTALGCPVHLMPDSMQTKELKPPGQHRPRCPGPRQKPEWTQHLKIKAAGFLGGLPLAKPPAPSSSFCFCVFTCKGPWWCSVGRGETRCFIFRFVFLRAHRKKAGPGEFLASPAREQVMN